MRKILSPIGTEIDAPESTRVNSNSFSLRELSDAKDYYLEFGYVVISVAVQTAKCDELRTIFQGSVKRYGSYTYRQIMDSPERYKFDENGLGINPLLNLPSLPTPALKQLRDAAIKLFTSLIIEGILNALFDENATPVQCVYFEGNSETWPHQDTYYLDSERIGTMTGCWFTPEDIDAGAEMFCVLPASHNIELENKSNGMDVAFNQSHYKVSMKTLLTENQDKIISAPFLRKRDILFQNSKTIRGGLGTATRRVSRSSLTAHYIPASHRFLQFQARIEPLALQSANCMNLHCPKDLGRFRNRMMLSAKTRFPPTFQLGKKLAIRAVVR